MMRINPPIGVIGPRKWKENGINEPKTNRYIEKLNNMIPIDIRSKIRFKLN